MRLHPDFEQNRLLYLSYVKPGAGGLGTLAVARGHFDGDRISDVEEIFHAYAHGNGSERSSMWGGRLAFDGRGYLFITLGERGCVYSGNGLPAYGNLIIVRHDEVYLSAYAYNRELLVAEGDSVRQGQAIAYMGVDENRRALLHFEIRKNGKPVDPQTLLPGR